MTTEKEWWFDDLLPAFSEDYAPDKPYLKECIKKIVKEQKKRDWGEFGEMVKADIPEELEAEEYDEDSQCCYCRSFDADCGCDAVKDCLEALQEKIDSKLKEL